MDKSYQPKEIEQRHYQRWEANGYFEPDLDRTGESYCIMIPPPNVTGTLHMGHAFQDTIMDALTRFHRMQGRKTLWQPGMDHAGIATQMVVERQLNAEGLSKTDLGRDDFVARVWKWKEESGGQISQQLRRMGASLAWSRDCFTMDQDMSDAVTAVFVSLYDEGLIYRGKRLVNWDPVLHTALSDLEVLAEEEQGFLWHFRYPLACGGKHLVVATTRPETMLGDSAVAVHPEDQRFRHLIGEEILLPLVGRRIPIIADEYVDPDFATGCVKITPAHDFNDYEIGQRHDLPQHNIFDDNAAINDSAPSAYRGMDRFDARKKVVADLEALGLLEKVEDYSLTIPRGDRSGTIVEPYLTDQWYVKIQPLAEPAIEAVKSGKIRFVPENWNKTYFDWMHNIQDWCISRQLWWGHRIPAWFDQQGSIYVAESEQAVRDKYKLAATLPLRQDNDVLDTWFSSALWPFSTLGWPQNSDVLKTFYPGNVLVTGFDIIFFWVARMIMMGLKFMGDVPFREVYIHGLIRDQHGQKMSKSKGNVLDPLDLIDGVDLETLLKKRTRGLMQPHLKPKIEASTRQEFPHGIDEYGTDALRFTFATLATTGRDIRFELGRIEGNKNFCNKIWNASRYVLMNTEALDEGDLDYSPADRWIQSRLSRAVEAVSAHMTEYRLDLAAQTLYEFTWHEFCDWYLELSKPLLQSDQASEAEKRGTRRTLIDVLEAILRLMHPLMPYITEEIWQQVGPRAGVEGDSIMLRPFPNAPDYARDDQAERELAWVMQFILGIRQIRGEMDIPPGKALPVLLQNASTDDTALVDRHKRLLERVARVESIATLAASDPAPASATALLGAMRLLVPMKGIIDVDAEKTRLDKQLLKTRGEIQRAQGKLGNEKFLNKAPTAVVEEEQQRLAEHERRLAQLAEQRSKLDSLK